MSPYYIYYLSKKMLFQLLHEDLHVYFLMSLLSIIRTLMESSHLFVEFDRQDGQKGKKKKTKPHFCRKYLKMEIDILSEMKRKLPESERATHTLMRDISVHLRPTFD